MYQTGPFYIFFCSHLADVEAILDLHTTVIDGRVINFQRCSSSTILDNISFENTELLWITCMGALGSTCLPSIGFARPKVGIKRFQSHWVCGNLGS